MLTRRDFLGRTAAGCLTARLASRVHALEIPLAFQLHAVRGRAAADLPGTLSSIAAMGYGEVELVSFRGYASAAPRDGFGPLAPLAPTAIREIIADANLRATSAHFKFDELQGATFADRVQWAQGVGLQYMTVADLPVRATVPEWEHLFELLNTIGERVKAEGMQLGLHTQNDLWRSIDGLSVMERLLAAVDAQNCRIQLDLSTTQSMQVDPVGFLRRRAARCFSVHLRDAPTPATPGGYVFSVPLGEGVLDLPGILAAARSGGITNFVVEMQTQPPADPFDALRRSALYIRGLP